MNLTLMDVFYMSKLHLHSRITTFCVEKRCVYDMVCYELFSFFHQNLQKKSLSQLRREGVAGNPEQSWPYSHPSRIPGIPLTLDIAAGLASIRHASLVYLPKSPHHRHCFFWGGRGGLLVTQDTASLASIRHASMAYLPNPPTLQIACFGEGACNPVHSWPSIIHPSLLSLTR